MERRKLINKIASRIQNMLARGTVQGSTSNKMQALQIGLMAGETKSDVEHFEPFGFTSRPLPGAEVIAAFFDGDRSHGIVLVAADRRYRLTDLEAGEAALHDAFGNKVHFKKDGTLVVVSSTKVQITSPQVTMSGDLHVTGSITADVQVSAPLVAGTTNVTFGGKSGIGHTHSGVQTGTGNTGAPT